MFLDHTSLVTLTGYKRPGSQYEWLRDNGWPVQRDAKGRPLLLRSVVEARLGAAPSVHLVGPNWSALSGPA